MTLLVRDEQDIIEANIDFHLSQGVDHIIVTDNLSTDETPRILEKHKKKGLITVIKENSDDYSQHKWVTRMAKMAYSDYDADWVINNDADEFWFPNDSAKKLKQVLTELPSETIAGKAPRVNFLPPMNQEIKNTFFDSMTIREVSSLNDIGKPLPPKTCHRGFPNIEVKQGNHHVELKGERLSPVEIPITILHFPLRSFTQFENKIIKGGAAYERNKHLDKGIGITWRTLYTKHLEGTLGEYYDQQTHSETNISDGLKSGDFVTDTRLQKYIHQNINSKE